MSFQKLVRTALIASLLAGLTGVASADVKGEVSRTALLPLERGDVLTVVLGTLRDNKREVAATVKFIDETGQVVARDRTILGRSNPSFKTELRYDSLGRGDQAFVRLVVDLDNDGTGRASACNIGVTTLDNGELNLTWVGQPCQCAGGTTGGIVSFSCKGRPDDLTGN